MYMLPGHVCYAPVYPRGRIAGGQDLAGQCTTLSSPHGSLLWTFTGWQSSGKLSQTSVVAEATYISFFLFGCRKYYWRCSRVDYTQALKDNLVMKTGFKHDSCHWKIQFCSVKFLWVIQNKCVVFVFATASSKIGLCLQSFL